MDTTSATTTTAADTTLAIFLAGIATTDDTNSATLPTLPVGPPRWPGVPPESATCPPGSRRPALLCSAAPRLHARGTASGENQRHARTPAHRATPPASRATSRQLTRPVILERPRERLCFSREWPCLGHSRAGRATTIQRRRGTGVGTTATTVAVVEVVAVAAMCRRGHHIHHNHRRRRVSGKKT